MRILMTIIVILSLSALGPLMPQWTLTSTLVYIGLWILFGGAMAWLLWPQRAKPILRVSAGLLGVLMTLSALDFLINPPQGGGTIYWVRSPITGFILLGIPAISFALTGYSQHLPDKDEETNSLP